MQRFTRFITQKVNSLSTKTVLLLLLFAILVTFALVGLASLINTVIPENGPKAPPAANAMDLLPTIDFSDMEPVPEPTTPPPTDTPTPRPPLPTPDPEADANFRANPPTSIPKPTNTPEPAPTGICQRTPEVQDAIIASIALLGPRMSCQIINPDELFRIRQMTVSDTSLTQKDLKDLPNLRELTISIDGRIERDAFANLTGLRSLNMEYLPGRPPHLIPGTFEGLSHLQALSLTLSPRASYTLERQTFRGLRRLKDLTASTIAGISTNALDDLPSLINISLIAAEAHEYDQPLVPEKLFHHNLSLEHVSLTNFQTPSFLNLGTPKAACHAIGSTASPGWADPSIQINVNNQTTELMEWSQPSDTTHTCKVIIGGAKIVEVPIPIS